ncbi:hypothetical protein V6N13_026814 [Hibiscus sabdariffa]
MHGLNGFIHTAPTKPSCKSSDTLEAIVQATCHNSDQITSANIRPVAMSSGNESSGQLQKKRSWSMSDSDQRKKHIICCGIIQEDKCNRRMRQCYVSQCR